MPLSEAQAKVVWESRWENWKHKAAIKHLGKYTYPSSERSGKYKTIQIVCPEHGEFSQIPAKHVFGQGCPKCAGHGTDKAIELKAKYPDWDWSSVTVKGTKDKFTLECPQHGKFETLVNRLMNKDAGLSPCPQCCRALGGSKRRLDFEVWEDRIKEKWGDSITLLKDQFDGGSKKAKLVCKDHGGFSSPPIDVANGHGCPECGSLRFKNWMNLNIVVGADQFVDRANAFKGHVYGYYKDTYVDMKTPMKMQCIDHGDFWQIPRNHLHLDAGCPSCAYSVSKGENQIIEFLNSLGVESEVRDRKLLEGAEIDIFVPKFNLGIEYCGLYWHSEFKKTRRYHKEKLNKARSKGITLITIFEDEWLNEQEKVKNRLRHMLQMSEKVPARACEVHEIDWQRAKLFLESHHIQGAGKPASICYGLFHGSNLVGVTTWGNDRFSKSGDLELYRLCFLQAVQGGTSKLVKRVIKDHRPARLLTYSDLRWGEGEGYAKAGFERLMDTDVGYFWCKGGKRFNRHGFQKHKLPALLEKFDPALSEIENCHSNGYWRVYDCGNSKWVMRIQNG